jgi:hypothetical protein
LKAFVQLLQDERPSILQFLESHAEDYARRLWRYVHKDDSEPTLAYIADVSRKHATSFPEGENLAKKFRLDVFPSNPVCAAGSRYEEFFGQETNESIICAIHEGIVSKRYKMFKSIMFLVKKMESLSSGADRPIAMRNLMKISMIKARSFTRQNFFGEACLDELCLKLMDYLMIEEERDPKMVMSMLASIAKYVYDDNVYMIRHFVK